MFTDKDLRIVISCNYLPHHHWMAFASWYSIYKNLPDAQVKILCGKSSYLDQVLFGWTAKFQVDFRFSFLGGSFGGCDLEIPCDTMAVREWIGPEILDCKSKDVATFCTYRDSCGDFVMAEWINSIVPPFAETDSFKKDGMTVNEFKILELWRKALSVYVAMG
jgi:hypothetical protein